MARGRSRRSGESNAFHSDRAAHSLPVAARLWRWSATITGRKDRQSSAITGGEHLVIISHHQQSADHHQLSSVSHHQHSSPVISRHQRSGISVTCEEPHVKQASIRCNQVQPDAIRSNQMQSDAIRSNQMRGASRQASINQMQPGATRCNQVQSDAIRSNQKQSDAIRSNLTCEQHHVKLGRRCHPCRESAREQGTAAAGRRRELTRTRVSRSARHSARGSGGRAKLLEPCAGHIHAHAHVSPSEASGRRP